MFVFRPKVSSNIFLIGKNAPKLSPYPPKTAFIRQKKCFSIHFNNSPRPTTPAPIKAVTLIATRLSSDPLERGFGVSIFQVLIRRNSCRPQSVYNRTLHAFSLTITNIDILGLSAIIIALTYSRWNFK